MKIKKYLFLMCVFIFFFLIPGNILARVGPTYAIVNCKIIPVSSPAIEKGVIIIRDGLIESLGPTEKISVPDDAEVIDAEGLLAYPGLIDAHTNLFIELPKDEEPRRRGMATGPQEKESGRYPEVMAFKLLKPTMSQIESYRKIGVTTVLVAPEKGIYTGQSVLLNLNGDKTERMVVKNQVALHINFATAKGEYPATVMGTMALLRQSFLDAQYYNTYKSLYMKAGKGVKRPEYNPFLEALIPFVLEKKPVVFMCKNQEDIKRALRLMDEFKINSLLSGANEAWRVSEDLKKAGVPLLVTLDFTPPYASIYVNQGEELKKKAEKEIYPANPSNLYKAGIKFALTSYGLGNGDKFLNNLKQAIKAGLPKEEALKALTIYPAQILGVSSLMGSIEPGKIANITLTSGEIFEDKAQVKMTFVDGILFKVKELPKEKAQTTLNISGKWKGTVSGPMGELETTVEFKQEGNEIISGTISSEFGKWEISGGTLSGNELDFTFTANIMGEIMEMSFSGKVEEDTIEGPVSFSGGVAELRLKGIPGESI